MKNVDKPDSKADEAEQDDAPNADDVSDEDVDPETIATFEQLGVSKRAIAALKKVGVTCVPEALEYAARTGESLDAIDGVSKEAAAKISGV